MREGSERGGWGREGESGRGAAGELKTSFM